MIVLVFGTRPEAIKLGPVAAALRQLEAPHRVICTGQHDSLLRGTPAVTDLAGATALKLYASGDPLRWAAAAEAAIMAVLDDARVVVVQGDTSSALAGARAGHARSRLVVHVEAGVRSGSLDEPWPEESFRREITQLASLHLAATAQARANLLAEGVAPERILVTGNSCVSALTRYVSVRPSPPAEPAYAILTMHRREWRERESVEEWTELAMHAAAAHPALRIIWPIHPGVKIPLAIWPAHVQATAPLPYREMLTMLAGATGVLTDSGGLVEEAATLGVPTAIMRKQNDRPEAVAAGIARQFAPSDIAAAFDCIATGQIARRPTDAYGAPDAADRIARALVAADASD